MSDVDSDPAVTVCFKVTIDGQDLGAFTSCDGLSFDVDVKWIKEGGNNQYEYPLPGRIKYQNIKLSRVINKDTKTIANWIGTMRSTGIEAVTGHIAALNSHGETVAEWALDGVIPIKWQGPSLTVDSPKVATETLEIAHRGFMPGEGL